MKDSQLTTLQDMNITQQHSKRHNHNQTHFKYFASTTLTQPSLSRRNNETTKTTFSSQKTNTAKHFFSLTTPSKYIHSFKRRIKHKSPEPMISQSKDQHSLSTIFLNKPIISKRFKDLWNNSNYNTSLKKIRLDTEVMSDTEIGYRNKKVNMKIKPRRKLYFPKHLIKKEISEIIREKYLTMKNSLLFSKNDGMKIESEIANLGKFRLLTEGSILNSDVNQINKENDINYHSKIPEDFLYKEIKLEPIKKKHFKFNNPIQRVKFNQFYTNINTYSFPGTSKLKLSTFNYQTDT